MLESVIISTLAGSIICSILLIFKNKLLALFGGRALYHISLIAMLLFLLPMNIGEISLPQPMTYPVSEVTEFNHTIPEIRTDTAPVATPQEQIVPDAQPDVLPKASNIVRRSTPVTVWEILIAIWLLGFVASMCRYFISYFRFKRKICGFERYENINGVEVIKSPLISSPMIFGFFKPTLAIPETEMAESDYQLAIKHEMVHYKHHDSWFKLFAVLVNSICWFNPVTYFMVNLIGEACEYACDEQVTKEMDMSDKKQYSTMILSMVCQASPALSSNMVKSKKQLKRRFEMIMKRKKRSVFKTALCALLMLTAACGSVVFANEITPAVASLLKDDYVYITNFGKGNYNGFAPVEKDGVYYVPIREFLNNSDVENDKIKYDNGTITVDIWSQTHKIVNIMAPGSEAVSNEDRVETTIPGKLVWTTSCSIGSREVIIDGNKYTLKNPPYLEDGITYVPYEYIKILKNYEETAIELKADFSNRTTVFVATMKYGFDSMESRFYIDDAEIDRLPREKKPVDGNTSVVVWSYSCTDADISIRKTGYRTEFSAKLDFVDINNKEDVGNAEIVLNKVTRIYSKGSDIEGLFTVKVDGETVCENEKGYITSLPIPAGEGIIDHGETIVEIGETKLRIFFFGFGTDSDADSLSMRNREIAQSADTKKLGLYPNEVKLNGMVVERTDKSNSFHFNTDEEYAEIYLYFDNYTGVQGTMLGSYGITRHENSDIKVIDENTFSGHFFFETGQTRIDSFDAIMTLLPDNQFELKSTDGRYIVRGTTGAYVPLWQWSDEQKNAPMPQVVMIDE